MTYQTGDNVPDFNTVDIHGNTISAQTMRGRTWLLSFLRFSTCALCNLRVHQLIERYPSFHQRGLEVAAVFESSPANVRANVDKQRVPFALVGDPEARLYDLLGVETSEAKVQASAKDETLGPKIAAAAAIGYPLTKEEGSNFFRMPADFLIGPDGRFLAAFYSQAIGSHLPFDTIEAVLLAQDRQTIQ